MNKSLTSRLHLKQQLYSHRLTVGGSLEDCLSVFKEIVLNLEIMKLQYDEEDLELILLCLLQPSYVTFRNTILYSRDTFPIEKIYDALYFKKNINHLVVKYEAQKVLLFVRER